MQYKPYGTRRSTPLRMARKHMRREVFMANRKAAKLRRKASRLKQESPASEQVE